MTKERFQKAGDAARELLRLRDEGVKIAPEIVAWADHMIKPRVADSHQKIMAVLATAPPDGFTYEQVAAKLSTDARRMSGTLSYMGKLGRVFLLRIHKNSRYFPTAAMRDAAKSLLIKPKPSKSMAWSERNKPAPKPHQTMQIKGRPADPPPGPRKPTIDESIFNPHGIKPTVIPTPVDNRFTADPNAEGAGFMAEWRAKRGQP